MRMIAKEKGVYWAEDEEYSEDFQVREQPSDYQFHEEGFGVVRADDHTSHFPHFVMGICLGSMEVIPKPWKPKKNETYWVICTDGSAYRHVWYNGSVCLSQFTSGNCFRTEEQALRDGPGVIAAQLKKYEEA